MQKPDVNMNPLRQEIEFSEDDENCCVGSDGGETKNQLLDQDGRPVSSMFNETQKTYQNAQDISVEPISTLDQKKFNEKALSARLETETVFSDKAQSVQPYEKARSIEVQMLNKELQSLKDKVIDQEKQNMNLNIQIA